MQFFGVLIMGLTIGVMVYLRLTQKKKLIKAESDHAEWRAGTLATTLGLELVEGDPTTNLFYGPSLVTTATGDVPEIRVHLEGSPNGRRTSIFYTTRTEVTRQFQKRTYTTWFRGEIMCEVRAPFPEFEILLKKPNRHFAAEMKPCVASTPVKTGDPQIDGEYIVKTDDARIGPVLVEPLRKLAETGWGWVQIHGKADHLTFITTKTSGSMVGTCAHLIIPVLHEIAANLEHAAQAHAPAQPSSERHSA